MLKRKKYIKLTQKELNAIENKAYLHGYEQGIKAGEQRAIFKNNTMNTIRALFDLPALPAEEIHSGESIRDIMYGNASITPKLTKNGQIVGFEWTKNDGE